MSADPFVDSIGNRLDRPDLVPPQYQHLIADDQQRVKRILEFPAHGRVLDVGTSDGAIARRIQQKYPEAEVWGCDARMVDPGVPFIKWDVLEPFPLKGAPLFDQVYACEVFEHLIPEDADVALRHVLAMLKTGGDLIVTVPNRRPADRYEVGMRSRWAWPDHRNAYSWATLSAWLHPKFTTLEPVPLYENEKHERSIWLIVRAKGKRA